MSFFYCIVLHWLWACYWMWMNEWLILILSAIVFLELLVHLFRPRHLASNYFVATDCLFFWLHVYDARTSSVVVQRLKWSRSWLMSTTLMLLLLLLLAELMVLMTVWCHNTSPSTVPSCSTTAERRQPHLIVHNIHSLTCTGIDTASRSIAISLFSTFYASRIDRKAYCNGLASVRLCHQGAACDAASLHFCLCFRPISVLTFLVRRLYRRQKRSK